MPVKRRPDYWIIVITVALLAVGIVMIFSSSAILAAERFGDTYYFLKRQAAWTIVGLAGMFAAMRIDYRSLSRYGYIIYFGAVLSLLAVLSPGVGHSVNGARRWIDLGFGAFQPSEFAKLALVIFFAALLAKKEAEGKLKDFLFGYAPNLVALGVVFFLVQLQPDLGTAFIIGLVAFFLFTMAGIRFSYLLGTALFMLPILWAAVYSVDYRRRRVMSFLDPWGDASDSGYQIIQSFVALSNGGLWGTGLGAGTQKLFYLPEPHTDFIFSIIGEELGFVGAFIVIALFAALTWRGFRAGLAAPDRFGSLLALGITFAMAAQAVINMSVAMGLAPTKGLPLPFISLGGSALVMWLVSVGLLANVSEHSA
ncbi:MAG: putative lipid II flippase FtsW [Candidatus Nitrospinota bacterium M3_3B_026]